MDESRARIVFVVHFEKNIAARLMPAGANRDFDGHGARCVMQIISRSEMTTVIITLRVMRNGLSGPQVLGKCRVPGRAVLRPPNGSIRP